MKWSWLFVVAALAICVQACSSTGQGSPEGTRSFLKEEMGRRGL
ncbi:hypothetical protein [uncultured Methylobacterium sp.]